MRAVDQGRRRRAAAPRRAHADAVTALMAAGFGVTLALAVSSESRATLAAPGGWATVSGRVTGLLGAYLLMILVVLVARLPAVERVAGHDKLLALHRRIAPWTLVALVAHAVLITAGYAAEARTGVLHELWRLLTQYPGMITAGVGLILLTVAGLTSVRHARRRMRHETWWAVHLYTYLALALAFSHQIATGRAFVTHPLAQAFWIALWLATAGVVLVYRVGCPCSARCGTSWWSHRCTRRAPTCTRSCCGDATCSGWPCPAVSSSSGGSCSAGCGGRPIRTRCRRFPRRPISA